MATINTGKKSLNAAAKEAAANATQTITPAPVTQTANPDHSTALSALSQACGFAEKNFPMKEAAEVVPMMMSVSPYVMWPYPISSCWGNVMAKFGNGFKQGRPVLVWGGDMIALDPMVYILMRSKQLFCVEDSSGNPIKMSYDSEEFKKGDRKEYVETVILVITDDFIVPARCLFKTLKVGSVYPAIGALAQCTTDEWAEKGPDFKATLAITEPRFRFKTKVIVNDVTAKSSGRCNAIGSAQVLPTTVSDWTRLAQFWNDEKTQDLLTECKDDYDMRIATLEKNMR
jgi:hypothetical protein